MGGFEDDVASGIRTAPTLDDESLYESGDFGLLTTAFRALP